MEEFFIFFLRGYRVFCIGIGSMNLYVGGGEKEREVVERCICKYSIVKFNRNKGIIVFFFLVKLNIYFRLKIYILVIFLSI